jgi:citrate lyase subunit beta/citryl-CoA lyase
VARPRRSILWVPGDQPAKLERAAGSGADVVVLDLEDGVAPDRKAVARDMISGALRDIDFGSTERLVRVCPGSPLRLDLAAAEGADGVCLPKVDGPADLIEARALAKDVLGAELPILAISGESPLGVLNAAGLAGESAGVVAWMWGSEDLAAALGCQPRRMGEPFVGSLAWARHVTVHLAAATGAQAIDTVYPFFKDLEGLVEETRVAAAVGYSGKGLIHPAQVSPVNDAFTPADAEIDHAQEVVRAFADGSGIAVLEGQMLDLPHLRAAERVLARAGVSRARLGDT